MEQSFIWILCSKERNDLILLVDDESTGMEGFVSFDVNLGIFIG